MMNDEEQQHSQREDEQLKSKEKTVVAAVRKRNVFTVLTIVALVAVAVTLGLLLGGRDDKETTSTSAQHQGGADSSEVPLNGADEMNNETTMEETTTASPTASNPSTWPHEESDIPLDPNLVVGQLETNGMKYMILKHPWPPEQVSLRLHFDVGSTMEDDDQLGLAHFLEHMLFNGLVNFPNNTVVEEMQRQGMDIGPHINAYTTFDETVYRLEAPDNDTSTLGLAFTVMRGWLDGALLEEEAIDAERGVVLAELRSSQSPRQRLQRQLFDLLIPDTLIPKRWPIGTQESLESMPEDTFRKFYTEYYTASRATIVASGDFELEDMKKRIVDTFSSAVNPEAPGEDPDLGVVTPGGFRTAVLTDDEFKYHEVYLYTVKQLESEPDTTANRQENLSLSIANRILSHRLSRLVLEEEAPITYGNAGVSNLDPARFGFVTVDAAVNRLYSAVQILETEFRRFLTYGATAQEFSEAKADILNSYERSVEGAATRESSSLASALSKSLNGRSVFSTPEVNHEIVSNALETLTPADVHADFVAFWETEDIALVYMTKEEEANTTEILLRAYNDKAIEVSPPEDEGNLTFAYTDFGDPGEVVSDVLVDDLEIRQLVLSNNVRVNLKRTAFEDNSVVVSATFGNGKLSQPPIADLDTFLLYCINLGGLGNHSNDELSRILSGKSVGVGLSMSADYFSFSGETEPEHLELQLQLLTAHISDPGYRAEAVRLYQNQIPARLNDFKHTLTGPGRAFSKFLVGDGRYDIPQEKEMMSFTIDQVKSWLDDEMESSYLELSIVGDFDDTAALDLILKTIGTLPSRAETPDQSAFNTDLVFPETPQSIDYTYDSKDPQAQVVVAYEIISLTENTVNESRYLNVLAAIYDQRLFTQLREELGATYSPGASSIPFSAFDHGEFRAWSMTAPENVTVVGDRILQIGDDLARDGVTEDDLLRALEPILSNIELSTQANGYWMNVLANCQKYPYTLDSARSREAVYRNVTVDVLNELAATYLGSEKSILATMVPVDDEDASRRSTSTSSSSTSTSREGGGRRDRSLALEGQHTAGWKELESSMLWI